MAMVRLLNQFSDTGHAVPWYISEVLCYQGGSGAGWTVDMSGSGVGGVYSATGDVFDRAEKNPVRASLVTDIGVGVGQEHFGGNNCWIVLGDPNGRQWLFYRYPSTLDANDDEWVIRISPGGNYTGGDASNRATATDDFYIWNYNTAAYASIFAPGGTQNLIHVVADSDPAASGEYGFWCLEMTATNSQNAFISQDPYSEYGVGDILPLVFWAMPENKFDYGYLGSASYYPIVYTQGTTRRYTIIPNLTSVYPNSAGINVYDSKERPFPMAIAAPTVGFLGLSHWVRWGAVDRDYPSTLNSKTSLCVGDAVLSGWDTAVEPLTIT